MAGIIYPNIEKRRDDLGVSKEKMREKLGISAQALTNKLDGTSEFTAREVLTLSQWWRTSADELLADSIILEKV